MMRTRLPTPSRSALVVDLVLLSATIIWGLNFTIMKKLYDYVHPLAFTPLRFVVAVVTLGVILRVRNVDLSVDRSDLRSIFALGLLSNGIYQILFVTGLANTRAGNASLIMSAVPVFAYVTGAILKREEFSHGVLGGIILSMTGVVAIVIFGLQGLVIGSTWKGDLLVLGSAWCWGVYTGTTGRLAARYSAASLTFWLMLSGTVVLVPLLLPWALRQDWGAVPPLGWLAACYSTFLSIVYCYLAWSFALRNAGVARTAVYSNVTPIITLLGSWAMLGETPTPAQLVGVALILSGVVLVRRKGPRAATGHWPSGPVNE